MTRTLGVCIGIALLLVIASPVLASEGPVLTGVVLDPLGSVVREAEIFLLTEAANHSPVAVAQSGHDGRFLVIGLAPGVYRVAAIKEGYRLYLGRINTALRGLLTPGAFVDAAAVIGAFNVVDRIANATGIPLDAGLAAMSGEVREELDLARFASSANTPGVG